MIYTYTNLAQLWDDAESLGWIHPIEQITDDTDPDDINQAEDSAIGHLEAHGYDVRFED